MTETLSIDAVNLPALLIQMIRGGTWRTENAHQIRQLARIVNRAQHAGLPTDDLLVVLASAAHGDLVPPNFGWSTEMKVLSELTWHMMSSANGHRDTIAKEYGPYPTLIGAIAVAQSYVADETAKRAMDPSEANAVIRAEMERVSALHPELGMSFGYIGNIEWGPRRDDRAFMVFTKLADRRGYSVSYGSHSHEKLGELAFSVKAKLESWAAEQVAKLKSGEHKDRRLLAA